MIPIKSRLHRLIESDGVLITVIGALIAVMSWLCVTVINHEVAISKLNDTIASTNDKMDNMKYSINCLALPRLGVDAGDKDCPRDIKSVVTLTQ